MMKSREEEPEGRDSYTPSEASDLGAEQDFESFARRRQSARNAEPISGAAKDSDVHRCF